MKIIRPKNIKTIFMKLFLETFIFLMLSVNSCLVYKNRQYEVWRNLFLI